LQSWRVETDTILKLRKLRKDIVSLTETLTAELKSRESKLDHHREFEKWMMRVLRSPGSEWQRDHREGYNTVRDETV
jgi:hypothetical protein